MHASCKLFNVKVFILLNDVVFLHSSFDVLGKGFLIIRFFLYVFIWVRATLPRYRYDQLMRLGWKVLIPLAILNLVVTGIVKVAVS